MNQGSAAEPPASQVTGTGSQKSGHPAVGARIHIGAPDDFRLAKRTLKERTCDSEEEEDEEGFYFHRFSDAD